MQVGRPADRHAYISKVNRCVSVYVCIKSSVQNNANGHSLVQVLFGTILISYLTVYMFVHCYASINRSMPVYKHGKLHSIDVRKNSVLFLQHVSMSMCIQKLYIYICVIQIEINT